MADITDQLFVVAGATGNVGEGVVRALLRHGARVAAIGRSADGLGTLRAAAVDGDRIRLIDVFGDMGSLGSAQATIDGIVARHGPIDHGVASLGQWWRGRPAWEVDEEEFNRFFVDSARLHFAAMRAIVPHLPDGGSYTMLAGLSAIRPIANLSLTGMQASAQVMLGQEVQADAGDRLRIYNVVMGFIVGRGRPDGRPDWLRSEEVGDVIARLAGSAAPGRVVRADDRPTVERSLREMGA